LVVVGLVPERQALPGAQLLDLGEREVVREDAGRGLAVDEVGGRLVREEVPGVGGVVDVGLVAAD
jgi:formate dehydrogenase assembly factor FdhD